MYCNICADDQEFIDFVNRFAVENNLLVYDQINEKWQPLIAAEPNSKWEFIYQLTTPDIKEQTKPGADFSGVLSVFKYQEAGANVFCGVVACTNVNRDMEKLLLKLKRRAQKTFRKGMKWAEERLNAKPSRILGSHFYSANLDNGKTYFTANNSVNPIVPEEG